MPVQDDNMTETDRKPQAKAVSTGRTTAPKEASKSEAPTRSEVVERTPQSYVWLANGEVLLVNDEDLPGSSGAQNPHGHWQKDGKVYEIVGIYAVEEEAA